jgi:hypothetical protein
MRKTNKLSPILGAMLVSAAAVSLQAHDALPPCWRGQPGSTFQEWQFDSNQNPASPGAAQNGCGPVSASINVDQNGSGWDSDFGGGFGLQTGLWDLGPNGSIVLTVANCSTVTPGATKYISVQVTDLTDPGLGFAPATVTVPGATLMSAASALIETLPPPGTATWRLNQTLWLLPSCPAGETITITAPAAGGLVDQVVVDTICLDPAGVISPAGTPAIGTQTSCLPVDFGPGGSYTWNLGTATGTAGTDWDLLTVTGDLTISASNGAPTANQFTMQLVSPPGGVAGFVNTASYVWPVATVSGTILGFHSAKFHLDATGIVNALGGGEFSMRLNGRSLEVVFTPAAIACAHTTTNWFGVVEPTPGTTNMVMTFTNLSGLSSVQAITLVNCTLSGVAYDNFGGTLLPNPITPITLTERTTLPANTVQLVVTATKQIQNQPAVVNLLVLDTCGRGASFDPIITTLEVLSGNQVQQRFEGILSAERYLYVQNGTPGLTRLELNLNGRVFVVDLTSGQTVAADVGDAMLEGGDNVVILTGYGTVGSSAFVTLTDTPAGTMQELEEIVTLAIAPGAGGLTLSWPQTLAGWQLEGSPTADGGWSEVTIPPTANQGRWTVAVAPDADAQFFRLVAPTATARPAATAGAGNDTPGASDEVRPQTLPKTHDILHW